MCVFGGGRGGRVWGVESQGIRRGTKNKIEVKVSEGEGEERSKQQLEKEKQELVERKQKLQYLLLSLIYTLAWLGCTFCYTKWKFQAILEVAIWAKQDILSVQHVMEKSVPVSVLKLACSTPFTNSLCAPFSQVWEGTVTLTFTPPLRKP